MCRRDQPLITYPEGPSAVVYSNLDAWYFQKTDESATSAAVYVGYLCFDMKHSTPEEKTSSGHGSSVTYRP